MSKEIVDAVVKGAHSIYKKAQSEVEGIRKAKGDDQKLEFPDTGYYMPLVYALAGAKITKTGELAAVMGVVDTLMPKETGYEVSLKTALNAGAATLVCEEVIEIIKYAKNASPYSAPFFGFVTDALIREQGIKLVDGRMPAIAVIVGACDSADEAVKLARELQEKHILTIMCGNAKGVSMAEQLASKGVDMNPGTFLVPLGKDISSAVLAANFAARAAMTFGGITPKGAEEAGKIIEYNKKRVHAFILALGDLGVEEFATAAGALNFGFPTISNRNIGNISAPTPEDHDLIVSPVALDKIVNKALEVRGVKIVLHKLPIPVPYGPGFEGERVRKENLGVEFGGKASVAFEYVRMRKPEEIENKKIELIGPELDTAAMGGAMPLGILVEVSGKKMQKDFESILERRIHGFLSEAHDVMHMNQRDKIWVRIGKEARGAGLKIKDFGVIIENRMLQEFSRIIDKIQVKLITDKAEIEKILPGARKAYDQRDEAMLGMTDESVDTFYSCQLCQSYAPNHLCVISPERLGLCGAYNWLDGKAAYEINPLGVNQPIKKGQCLDPVKGQWQGINEFVYQKSNRAFERFNKYSIMEDPETSCVVGETEVVIDNKAIRIDEFINKHRGGEEYARLSCLTLDDKKAISDKIISMQKFKAPSGLISIQTKSGNNLILTMDHKIAVDAAAGKQWKPAKRVKKGDRIYSLKNLRVREAVPDIIDMLPVDFKKPEYVLNFEIKKELFYLLGLISSDGCITKIGRYERKVSFINTDNNLIENYHKIYKEIFPTVHAGIRQKEKTNGKIKGRMVKSVLPCFLVYSNNSVFGLIAEYFGVRAGRDGKWDLKNMLSLPKEFIAEFLSGIFDGDGSIRLRRYDNKWLVPEAYLCTEDINAARDIKLLLKRFGIIGNLRKDGSVYKIELYGRNLAEFITTIESRHTKKSKIVKEIKENIKNIKLDKSQTEVLPLKAGSEIARTNGIEDLLSPSTLFYYKTGRSRPVKGALERLQSPGRSEILKKYLDTDYFLDTVKDVSVVRNDGRYDYVYNLTLSNIHSYIVNGGPLIKNCGCFECIVAIIPEANGVMIVNRGFAGMTPAGMTFSTLAGTVGGGNQVPGFIGIGRLYIVSKKFISAEGGFERIVWMPKELKEELAEKLQARAKEIGKPDFMDMVADETAATTPEELMAFLQKVNHPALSMPPLM